MITVVVADKNRAIRRSLRYLLESQSDIRVIGEAGDARGAMRLVGNLQPDILVTDLNFDSTCGMEIARQVGEGRTRTRVIVVGSYDNDCYAAAVLEAGAWAFLLKETAPDRLLPAVRAVMEGNHYLGPPLSETSLGIYLEKRRSSLRVN